MQVEWSESDKGELHGREKVVVTVKEGWGWLQAKWGEGMNEMEKVVQLVKVYLSWKTVNCIIQYIQ